MESCRHFTDQLPFYLDDELHGDERAALEDHIEVCGACRGALARERRFLDSIRSARPIYQATPELRARVEFIVNGKTAANPSAAKVKRRRRPSLSYFTSSYRNSGERKIANRRRRIVFVATVAAAMIMGTIYLSRHRGFLPSRQHLSDFALLAVDTHLRHLRGQLPLEIITRSPERISQWFGGKVPFGLKLPNYQEVSGQERLYELEGARLVGFNKDYAAYVAYEMRQRPITLVITSDTVARPSGGEQVESKGIMFHYDSVNGLKVLTWSDRGLTYALVSDLEERGQQSCLVCHAGTKDRDFLEKLKPAR